LRRNWLEAEAFHMSIALKPDKPQDGKAHVAKLRSNLFARHGSQLRSQN
jgi:hypothetical protein